MHEDDENKDDRHPFAVVEQSVWKRHHETAQTLALESTEQKLSHWQRLRRAWRG